MSSVGPSIPRLMTGGVDKDWNWNFCALSRGGRDGGGLLVPSGVLVGKVALSDVRPEVAAPRGDQGTGRVKQPVVGPNLDPPTVPDVSVVVRPDRYGQLLARAP